MIKQYEEVLAQSGPPLADLLSEVDRRANLWTLQMQSTGSENNNPVFVTKPELGRWLAPYLITQGIDSEPGDNAALQMQRLMDRSLCFTPLLEHGRFVRVVDKQALAEQIALIFVREQVSRALTMIQ